MDNCRSPLTPSQALARAVAELRASDPAHRRVAAQTLGGLLEVARPAVSTIVEQSIVDPDPLVRYALLGSLEEIGWHPAEAVEMFAALLDHPDAIAQARAAWALGRVGIAATSAMSELVRVASDARRIVDPRWSAVVAIGMLGRSAASTAPDLVALLRGDPNPDIREAAARTLGAVAEDATVTNALVTALADSDQLVRESAVEGLVALGKPLTARSIASVVTLLDDPWTAVRLSAMSALEHLAPDGTHIARGRQRAERRDVEPVLRPLLDGLESADERTRGISTFEIGKLGPEAECAVPILARLLTVDRNLDVRWSAAWALGKMGAGSADGIPALGRALRYDLDPDVRAESAWALGRIRRTAREWRPPIDQMLMRAAADEDSLVRSEARSALR